MRLRPLPLVLGLIGLFAACGPLGGLESAMEPFVPKVSFKKVAMQDINWEQVDVNLVFDVENPNPLKVAMATFGYGLELEGVEVVKGKMSDGFSLPAEGKTKLKVPMTLTFASMNELLTATKGKDQLGMKMSGRMGFNTPVGLAKVPYKAEGEMPVLRTPQFSFKNVKVKEFEPLQNKATINVNLGVLNKGGSNLSFKDFDYDFKLDGTSVGSGKVSDLGDASADETSTLTLPIDISLTNAGTAIVSLLSNKGDAKAVLSASTTVGTPFGDIPLSIDESGKVSLK